MDAEDFRDHLPCPGRRCCREATRAAFEEAAQIADEIGGWADSVEASYACDRIAEKLRKRAKSEI